MRERGEGVGREGRSGDLYYLTISYTLYASVDDPRGGGGEGRE